MASWFPKQFQGMAATRCVLPIAARLLPVCVGPASCRPMRPPSTLESVMLAVFERHGQGLPGLVEPRRLWEAALQQSTLNMCSACRRNASKAAAVDAVLVTHASHALGQCVSRDCKHW